jgi:hypothetical protein
LGTDSRILRGYILGAGELYTGAKETVLGKRKTIPVPFLGRVTFVRRLPDALRINRLVNGG